MNTDAPVVLTSEEIAQAVRMESIFCPQTRKLRDDKFSFDNPPGTPFPEARIKFAHYTTAEAAMGILSSKRLWMRSTTAMADFSEVVHGYNLLRDFFQDSAKHQRFLTVMNAILPNAGNEAIGAFDRLWGNIRDDTYITCMSAHRADPEDEIGRLSMWRGFGGDVPRVALVFSFPWLANVPGNIGVLVSPCAYFRPGEGRALLDQITNNAEQNATYLAGLDPLILRAWMVQSLIVTATCSKHYGFAEEQEWRAVHTPALGLSTIVESKSVIHRGVPQKVFQLPLDKTTSPKLKNLDIADLIDRVIIGPTQYGSVMKAAFTDALSALGILNAGTKVFNSHIPIRS